jgi:hypothetical protein
MPFGRRLRREKHGKSPKIKGDKMPGKKKLTSREKYNQLKKQTESAGMEVKEKNRKVVVSRKKKKK